MGDLLGEAAKADAQSLELLKRNAIKAMPKRLQSLYDLMCRKGIDLADMESASVKSAGFYEGQAKNADDEIVVTTMSKIEFAPSWDTGPAWPVIKPGPMPKCPPRAKRPKTKGWQTSVLLPDMQMGYWRDMNDELQPFHDEAAIAIALAVVADEQPDVVVLHGDNADFAELSRFRTTPVVARTTQATIDRCALLVQQLRTAAPAAQIVWLEGNHEARLPFYILDNAKAAFAIRRGLEPEGWPVMSMRYLCHMDDAGVEYLPGYPASEFWLNDNFSAIHGHKVNSSGMTTTKYLNEARQSVAYGHIHRRELAQRTRHTINGPRTVTAVSFGCLCRIDGVVPSTKGGFDDFGQPVKTTEDWQQGVGVVRFQPGDGLHVIEHVEILNGWAMHRGQEYRA